MTDTDFIQHHMRPYSTEIAPLDFLEIDALLLLMATTTRNKNACPIHTKKYV